MTQSPTSVRTESLRIPLGKPPVLLGRKLMEARKLQRKGFTMSEIAEELDVRDGSVIRALYWDVVAK